MFMWLTLMSAIATAAPRGSDGRFAAYLAPLVKSGDFNGVVIIARGDRVVFQHAYGKADWDLDVPLVAGSRFRIASITKTFTAAAITLLAERGRLSYADLLSKYLPDFPNAGRITIRHLLLHQSGVPNPDSPTCSAATLDDLISELSRKPLWFEPGKSSGYSNGGYAVLARVVERASGMPWAVFIRDEIVKPLKMRSTGVDLADEVIPGRVRGFVPAPGPAGVAHAVCDGAWAAFGSGALVSSANDLLTWARAVRNDSLFKRTALEYPYGWGVRKYFDHAAIEQSGIINGSSSYLAVYPNDDLYVVALANVQTGRLTDIGKGLAALALGAEPPKIEPSPLAVAWPAEDRKRWVGRFKNDNIATVEIIERGSELYIRWGDSPEVVWISSTGSSQGFDRQDAVAMELAPAGDPLRMRWGDGRWQDFKRVP